MKSDLGNAEDSLILGTYPGSGNYTQFVYDPNGELVKIIETVASSVTSTKQFVRCNGQICEERDGSGSLSNGKQFFPLGQVNFASGTPTNYFYTTDHPSSVREMTKTVSGTTTIESQYAYSPFGEVTKLQGSADADFGYAGYYVHTRSRLNLTMFRAYNPGLGRFINRDPIGENGGTNLYGYVRNNPINFVDPLGLDVFVYTSPAFGGLVGQHVFAYGTDIGQGAGRGGMFGNDWGRKGYPNDFNPNKQPYSSWPRYHVATDSSGLYNGLTEQQFIDFLKSKEAGLNDSLFIPVLNDCHNSLERGFNRAGVEYPGSPLGRFGKIPAPEVPFPASSFAMPNEDY